MSRASLTDEQLAALGDAHASAHNGGLVEALHVGTSGTYWISAASEREHRNSTVHFLHTEGLLNRVGDAPGRTATITEIGILELDCAGVTE